MNLRITRLAPAALLALGLVLSAGPAAALGFNWSFNGVEGMVTGLLDDTAGQAATSVMLTNAGGLSHPVPDETIGFAVSNLWTVAGGAVTAVAYRAEGFDLAGDVLDLTNFAGLLVDGLFLNTVTGTVVFTPKVPEPATALLVGAAGLMGLALCRRLR